MNLSLCCFAFLNNLTFKTEMANLFVRPIDLTLSGFWPCRCLVGCPTSLEARNVPRVCLKLQRKCIPLLFSKNVILDSALVESSPYSELRTAKTWIQWTTVVLGTRICPETAPLWRTQSVTAIALAVLQ